MPGKLYIVATPIGNLADISLRALSVLKEVELIAAEDTRVTQKLLSHFGISAKTTAYHQHSLGRKAQHLLELLKEGQDIAVVSDAGMPGISDPGHELINLAIEQGITVVPIPGANAVITALVVSGLSTVRFSFEGFPARRGIERRAQFRDLSRDLRTMVFYESPRRILATLKDIHAVLGDRRVAVVREATKIFEEVFRGTATEAIEHFTKTEPRGEMTLVVEGFEPEPVDEVTMHDSIDAAIAECLKSNMTQRDAARQVASMFPVTKSEIYRRMLQMRNDSEK
jgi:16S rRNA (cytidine1402-2'-O)-methyltransferase